MSEIKNSSIPHVLGLNRVKRAYIGGKLLSTWQGIENPEDNIYSEEFLSSTVEVTNADKAPLEGLSKTILPNGEMKTLKDLIAENYEEMLGADYAEKEDVCVSARIGDTTVRLVLQCHPDTQFANEHLKFPNGKSEAWYIVDTREIDGQKPILYAGFKPGTTREIWYDLYKKQDIQGMLDCMHVLPVEKGGVYFVPAGMPHCLGAGSMFLEIHEPCDYTFKVEKKYLPTRTFEDCEMHYNLGNDLLMDSFHYDTYTLEEIEKICILSDTPMFEANGVKATEIVSYEQAERFKVERYDVKGEVTIPRFEGHRIAITVKGETVFSSNGVDAVAPQGRAVFLPYGCTDVTLKSTGEEECMILVCYPPAAKVNPKEVFSNPIQVGILTHDLEDYLGKLENVFGMGPWRIAEYPPAGATPFMEYYGKEANFKAKFCFFHLGNIEIEVIQPLEGDNIWSDWLAKHGNGIHHIKFLVKDHGPVNEYLADNGYTLIQRGQGVGPNADKVWQFFNTFDDIGFDIETMNIPKKG